MLNELCRELRNWFDRGQPKLHGTFTINNGHISNFEFIELIQHNQYFRIMGSVFNDGVYQYTDSLELIDEKFNGYIWLMAIPKDVVTLSDEIDAWINKYGESISSPYTSESFGGYSYTKMSNSSGNGSDNISWQNMFASKLNQWRKI